MSDTEQPLAGAEADDILGWLNTAIATREEAARAASPSPWSANEDDDSVMAVDGIAVAEVFALGGGQLRATIAHIALNDPESVLRRCAADRKLIYEVRRTARNAKDHPWDPMYGPYADAMLAAAKVVAEGYGWTG